MAAHVLCAKGLPTDFDCEFGPFTQGTIDPARAPWMLRWWLLFKDNLHIRTTELFERTGNRNIPDEAKRAQFSFHYGPTPVRRDKNGWPRMDRDSPTIIRIDLAPDYADHIHYAGEDHVPQSRVKGMTILDLDPFQFVEGILRHRRSGESIDKCFGFTVERIP